MHLLIVDTTGIQPYIFGSNRLRENIGASHLVAQATGEWAMALMPSPHNINAQTGVLTDARLERDGLAAEVIYAGGGNFVALFRDKDGAKEFTRKLSRKALAEAPNLQLVITHQPFDWSKSLYEEVQDTFIKLAQEKRARALSAPLLGLSVTVMCQSTGLPATEVTPPIRDDKGYPAAAEIHAKIAVATRKGPQPSEADLRLGRQIPPPDGYDYPREFDDLGGTRGEHSYIAVVHADGNGMGDRIRRIGKGQANRDYIMALRRFSGELEKSSEEALKKTLEQLAIPIKRDGGSLILHKNDAGKLLAKVELKKQAGGGSHYLPFRPIVFGGDDVTFVCDGRLGLSLAVEYLKQFEAHTAELPDGKGKATACAGVAIVKTHYPFARAYSLAEGLCNEAKKYLRRESLGGSGLDWHFALSGLSEDIGGIRRREYKDNTLTLRPVTLGDNAKDSSRAWDVVRGGITSFQGERWAGRRNKVKALRDALRESEGGSAVERFLTIFDVKEKLPDLGLGDDCKSKGWYGGRCAYFDAVEMLDWFIPL
jgi:hypothetical protein